MKKVIFAVVAAALLIAGSIFVIAQKVGNKDGRGFGPGHGRDGGFGIALRGLDLTDEQKAKVKEIMESGRANAEPLIEQMRDNHEKISVLGTDGKFNQAQVEALAAEQGNITAKMIVEKEKIKAQIFAILTDEQKAKAEALRTKFEEKLKARKGMGDKPAGLEF